MCNLGRVDVSREIWLNCEFSSVFILQEPKICFLGSVDVSREIGLQC